MRISLSSSRLRVSIAIYFKILHITVTAIRFFHFLMSEHTVRSENENGSRGTTIRKEDTNIADTINSREEQGNNKGPDNESEAVEETQETTETPKSIPSGTTIELTLEENGVAEEKSSDSDEDATKIDKHPIAGLDFEDEEEIAESLEDKNGTEAEGEELTEGEKMLKEIDSSKVIEETDTELDYQNLMPQAQTSIVTLEVEELADIRGLAEVEHETPSGSGSQKEVAIENFFLTRHRSMRQSIALKMLEEGEATEKRSIARTSGYFPEMTKKEKVTIIEEEEEEEVIKVEEMKFTREELHTMHQELNSSITYIRAKNNYLQRKCVDFFKKRRMDHALHEESVHSDALEEYEKRINRLADFLDMYAKETEKIGMEMEALQKERDEKYQERDNGCQKKAARQREIGIGLIYTKTGKEISDKVVDHLIRRQNTAAKQISQLRLKFITFRNEIAEKTAELKSLDNIGDDLSLMDYEQLKIQNRALSDKLEEKEEELTKLRVKCRNAVQIMAHVREKSAALDADMDVLKDDFEDVHYEYIQIRENLNFYKTERDVVRNKTMKLKAESGLLTKPKLLQDMETSMQEVKLYEKTLQKFKNAYNEKTQKIRNLRKNIAYEIVMNKRAPRVKKKKTIGKFFQVRPTLIVPKLPTGFFDRMPANLSSPDTYDNNS